MKLNKKYFGAILAILVLVFATGASYLAFSLVFESGTANEGPGIQSTQPNDQPTSDGNTPLMLSIGVGVAMSLITFASWEGARRTKKDAAELLLDQGLENMTVKDLVIVRRLIQKEEFTIPQLVEDSPVSRSSVWRLVKKLDEKGLIDEKDESEIPDGTRGKPKKVYRFVGPK